MKALRFSLATLLLLVSCMVADAEEISKSLHKEYSSNENTLLEIINKYGDVEIENWDKNQIVIDVEIIVEHTDEDKAKDLLDLITVDFSQSGNNIKAETDISEKFSRMHFSFNNSRRFEINYKVKMPAKTNLTLSNRYGDAFINEIAGHVTLNIRYGNIKVNKLSRGKEKPFNEINLGYTDGTVVECGWAKVNLSYSKLEIENSKALIAVSKYSKFYVDKASSIVCDSKYDTYRIGELANFAGEGSYTTFDFDEIHKKFDIDNRYGRCYIDYVPSGFEEINIENEYGSFRIGIESGASYKLYGEAKYASISYPDRGRVSRIKESTRTSVKGVVGDNKDTKSLVEIKTRYGNVKLD